MNGKKNAGSRLDAYRALLVKAPPRPIRTPTDHRQALRVVEAMMTNPHLGKAESQYLELLSTLIEHYETQEHPTPHIPPRKLLAHLLEERGVSQAEVARATKIPRGTLSNVLAGRRELSKANIVSLSAYFNIAAGSWF